MESQTDVRAVETSHQLQTKLSPAADCLDRIAVRFSAAVLHSRQLYAACRTGQILPRELLWALLRLSFQLFRHMVPPFVRLFYVSCRACIL